MDKRTEFMVVKVTKEEKELLKKLAEENHLKVASYIRYKCLNGAETNKN